MDILAIIGLVVRYVGVIKAILDIAKSNEDIVAKIKELAGPLADILENIGATLFPNAKSELHIAAGAIAAFDPNITKWIQGCLNAYVTPSPNLTVDGIYGPKTKAAVELFQTKAGLVVDGWAGILTQAALSAYASK